MLEDVGFFLHKLGWQCIQLGFPTNGLGEMWLFEIISIIYNCSFQKPLIIVTNNPWGIGVIPSLLKETFWFTKGSSVEGIRVVVKSGQGK